MMHPSTASGPNRPAIALAAAILAIAAVTLWLAYENGTRQGFIVPGLLVIAGVLVPQTLLMANQWERAVVLRLGKLRAIRGPGLFVILPFVDAVASWLDQRIR